jgi:outer membrane protein TolC
MLLCNPLPTDRQLSPTPDEGRRPTATSTSSGDGRALGLPKRADSAHNEGGSNHSVSAKLTSGILIGAALLTGCAHFDPQPISPADTAARIDNRSLTNSELRGFVEQNLGRETTNWPAGPWDFDMLTLAALYYSPALEIARAQWSIARAGQTTAAQRPNPVLNVTPGYDITTRSPSPWIPLGYLDVPIETAGKRGYRRAEAGHLSEAARLNLSAVAWQVRSQLRSGLVEFEASRRRTELLRGQIKIQERVVTVLEQQAAAGAIPGSQVLPERIALARTRLDLADSDRVMVEARARVAEALGVPVRALEAVKLGAPPEPAPEQIDQLTSAEVRHTALLSRPDLLSLLAEYAATQSALQLEIAKQYPDVHLQPGYQYDQGDSKWTLGIVVDLPVLHQNQGPIAQARAKREEAAARFEALQTKVLGEIDRATQVLKVTQKNSANLRALAEAQSRHRDAVEAQVNAGVADPVDLVNAEYELSTAALLQLDGDLKLQQAAGALEDAVRRPILVPESLLKPTRSHAR